MSKPVGGGQEVPFYKSNLAIGLAGAALTLIFAATAGVGGASLFQHLHNTTNGVLQFMAKIPEGYAIGMTAGGGALALATIGGTSGILIHRKVEEKEVEGPKEEQPNPERSDQYLAKGESLQAMQMKAFHRYRSTDDRKPDAFIVMRQRDNKLAVIKNIKFNELDAQIKQLKDFGFNSVGRPDAVEIADD